MPKTNYKRILLSKKKKNRKQNSLKKNKIKFQKKTVLKKRRQFTRKSEFTIPVSKRKTSCRRKRTNRYRRQGGSGMFSNNKDYVRQLIIEINSFINDFGLFSDNIDVQKTSFLRRETLIDRYFKTIQEVKKIF